MGNLVLKQYQEKTRWIQKRQLENQARIARGEDPLPDEDLSKMFKTVGAPHGWRYPVPRPWHCSHFRDRAEQASEPCIEAVSGEDTLDPEKTAGEPGEDC